MLFASGAAPLRFLGCGFSSAAPRIPRSAAFRYDWSLGALLWARWGRGSTSRGKIAVRTGFLFNRIPFSAML